MHTCHTCLDFFVCTVMQTCHTCFQMERSYRVDFLLQKDYSSEKARTQKIVDNMLPPYVTKKMKAQQGKNEIIGMIAFQKL